MIVEVRNAFKDNVNSIPWMDNVTKMAVMDKVLASFTSMAMYSVWQNLLKTVILLSCMSEDFDLKLLDWNRVARKHSFLYEMAQHSMNS